jgi:hypothetical protein
MAEHNRLKDVEDFDVTLQLLRMGYQNAVSNWYCYNQPMTGTKGGASSYRTNQLHDEEVRKLANFHPGFVRIIQKHNKTDAGGFGTRTEVVISWKKAYEESQKC